MLITYKTQNVKSLKQHRKKQNNHTQVIWFTKDEVVLVSYAEPNRVGFFSLQDCLVFTSIHLPVNSDQFHCHCWQKALIDMLVHINISCLGEKVQFWSYFAQNCFSHLGCGNLLLLPIFIERTEQFSVRYLKLGYCFITLSRLSMSPEISLCCLVFSLVKGRTLHFSPLYLYCNFPGMSRDTR